MTSKLLSVTCAAIAGVFGVSQARADTMYTLDAFLATAIGISGSITTDGNTGTLQGSDIKDWNINFSGSCSFCSFNLNGTNSAVSIPITGALSATATSLSFNFSDTVGSMFEFLANSGGDKFQACDAVASCLNQNNASDSSIIEAVVFAGGLGSTSAGVSKIGTVEIGAASATTTTPLPISLPLFATGLGAVSFLGWRRKRKARAVA